MKMLGPFLLVLALGLSPTAFGSAAADEALAADMAFALRAGEIGYHAAFIEYLAPDAVLFRPEAVLGQEWLATHEPAGGRLEWTPAAAAAACDGTLAITTGPWRYANASGGEPVAGHYISIWRRDADLQWRVLLDHGVDHEGAAPAGEVQAALARLWPQEAAGRCTGRGEVADLDRAEARLDARVAREGWLAATRRAAGEGALAYRDDAPPGPLAGLPAAADAAFGPGTTARAVGTVFAPGADFAVTHGTLQSGDGRQRALYVRVWARERRRWQVAIDLRTPLPAP